MKIAAAGSTGAGGSCPTPTTTWVVGSGIRLFADDAAPAALKLVETKTTGTGVVIHVYQSAGKPTFGSFALD